jgi:hypothetical protein
MLRAMAMARRMIIIQSSEKTNPMTADTETAVALEIRATATTTELADDETMTMDLGVEAGAGTTAVDATETATTIVADEEGDRAHVLVRPTGAIDLEMAVTAGIVETAMTDEIADPGTRRDTRPETRTEMMSHPNLPKTSVINAPCLFSSWLPAFEPAS